MKKIILIVVFLCICLTCLKAFTKGEEATKQVPPKEEIQDEFNISSTNEEGSKEKKLGFSFFKKNELPNRQRKEWTELKEKQAKERKELLTNQKEEKKKEKEEQLAKRKEEKNKQKEEKSTKRKSEKEKKEIKETEKKSIKEELKERSKAINESKKFTKIVKIITDENDPLYITSAKVINTKTEFLKISGVDLKYSITIKNQTPKIINTVSIVWQRSLPFETNSLVSKETKISKPIVPYEERVIEYNEPNEKREAEIYKVKISKIIFEDGGLWKNPSS